MNLENLRTRVFVSKEKQKQRMSPKEKYSSSPHEVILESRDFEREGELLGGAIGNARFVKIRNDGGGVFKPHNSYEGSTKAEYIARERAAYLISRFLGFNFVPPTVIKVINGEEGSLQEFVEDAEIGFEAGDIDKDEITKLIIFDQLITNIDRNKGNYLVKNGKIFAIDHGLSLLINYMDDISVYINPIPSLIPADIAENIKRFVASEDQKEILEDLLAELLGEGLARKFIKRVVAFASAINTDYSFDLDKFNNLIRR